MNTKALIKAMQFLCLPTLSVLVVIYIGFFNWSKFVGFVTSDDGWAIFFRVGIFIAEIILVIIMYNHYNEIMPNESYNKKLHESLMGDKFKEICQLDTHRGGSKVELNYNDEKRLGQCVATYLDSPSSNETYYRVHVLKAEGVENCLILKTFKS